MYNVKMIVGSLSLGLGGAMLLSAERGMQSFGFVIIFVSALVLYNTPRPKA